MCSVCPAVSWSSQNILKVSILPQWDHIMFWGEQPKEKSKSWDLIAQKLHVSVQ